MQGSNAVGGMGAVNGQFSHMYAAVKNDTEGRRDFFSGFFHFFPES